MYYIWILIFSAQPWVLIPAMFGLFGTEAEEAAHDFSLIVVVIVIILIVGISGFLLLNHLFY